jgi:rhodanese-related sulfurtransferase
LAVEMGYKNIFVYAEGIPGWAKARYPLVSNANYPEKEIPIISSEQLAKMDKGSIFLADIRPPADFSKGRIQGSKNIDMDDIHVEFASLPKDKKIVLVDHKGYTSLITGRFLASKGYTDVARLDGGFNAWEKSGGTAGK